MTDEEIVAPAKSSNAGMMAAILLVVLIPLIVFFVVLIRPNPTTYRYTIAKGTQAATESGQPVANPLPTELTIKVGDVDFAILHSLEDDLRFVTITSSANLELSNVGLEVLVRGSQYKKCGRCWHHTQDVGANAEHPELCGRCISNLFGNGEARLFA